MATTEKERVHLFAADQKHTPFYDAIVAHERSLGNEVQISWLKSDPRRTGFWDKGIRGLLWKVARRPEPKQRIYLEEYLGLGHLLFTWLFCLWRRQIEISLCVHNLNKWFFLEYGARPKRVATFFAGSLLLRRAREVVVISAALKKYGENICRFQKTFRVVSFVLPAVEPGALGRERLITIPGNVEEQRRDYLTVFAACRRLAEEGVDFKLVLLGKLKAESMSATLRAAVDGFARDFPDRLVTFTEFIPEDRYVAYVAGSTCLIANLAPYFNGEYGTVELYGQSKETGIRAWADSYDKVCLTPHEMPPGAIPQNYRRYGNAAELYGQLRQLL